MQLKTYQAQNGHCNVPCKYQTDPALGRWVNNQRQKLKKNALRHDRAALLDAIGFRVDLLPDQWNENYSKLKAYHSKHGHCNVPKGYQADPALGRWVGQQRQKFKHNALCPNQKDRLDAIWFQADPLAGR